MVGFAMERGVTMTDEQLVYAVVEGRGQMQGREDSVMVAALPLALPGSELQQPLEIRTSSQQELTTAIVRLGGSLPYCTPTTREGTTILSRQLQPRVRRKD